jgi:hypothetical protein
MTSPCHPQKIEVLIGGNQGVDDLKGRCWIDVIVQLPDDQHQLSLQAMGVVDVALLSVVFADRPAHPEFIPPDFVHPVVVATAVGDCGIVEVTVEEECSERILSTG